MSVAAIPSPEEVAPALEPRPGVNARPVVSEPVDREAQLEARIRQLESMVGQLSTQVQQLTKRSTTTSAVGGNTSPERAVAGGTTTRGTAPLDVGNAATAVAPSRSGGAGAPGQSLPPNPSPSSRFNSPATLDSFRSNVTFGPGFEIRSDNDEYILQFHNLTQYEYRGYQQANQNPVQNGFLFPRQWFMFSGRLSKPFGYFVSLANGFDTVSILDCFLDVELDPRLRFRIGRFKTPFTYEFFVEPIQGLVVPERSVFFNNFALNRSDGLMAFGRLFANQVDYAAGMFNGTRNSLINTSGGNLAALAFINWRPFAAEENTLRENFNLGGSVMAGNDFQTPVPQTFRTIVPTNGNAVAGIPFLALNNNVVNNGPHAFWDLHAAWYYRGLEVIGEWGSGFEDYGLARSSYRNRIPVESFYVQTSYLLTGETRSNIGLVKPLHPVTLKKGDFGIGAWEPYARFEYLDIGSKIFTAGLADENLWTNRLYMTHVGINWHLTQYIKIYFDWNYAEFGQPVLFAPGRRQASSDLFLLRFQFFF